LKKSSAKNFCSPGDVATPRVKTHKSFLLLFFKKEAL